MIETGRIVQPLQKSPHMLDFHMDEYETISNHYDTMDTISNSISEISDTDFCDINNPMMTQAVVSNDVASYETIYKDVTPSAISDNNEKESQVDESEDESKELSDTDNSEALTEDSWLFN